MNLKERAEQLKTDIPALFIAMKRKETPLPAKIIAAVAVGYALSPVDLIPDFIPVIGLLDDALIVPGLIALVLKLIPAEVFEECREEAADLWVDGKPKKWYYALPVFLVWLLLIFIVVKAIWL
ncbi:MAG: YkvA family protein [Eubacteriaceae bacterium]|nr:YkvA family protein [Eubacteriaceae bacterium]